MLKATPCQPDHCVSELEAYEDDSGHLVGAGDTEGRSFWRAEDDRKRDDGRVGLARGGAYPGFYRKSRPMTLSIWIA